MTRPRHIISLSLRRRMDYQRQGGRRENLGSSEADQPRLLGFQVYRQEVFVRSN